jgi:acyl carrier protein
VREAVVLARDDEEGEGGKRLVAYYTGEDLSVETLRDHLSSSLPVYMVPAAYVRLETLPLTPNGKLDRRALPEPKGNGYVKRVYEPPVGETETLLARVWADLFKLEGVGRNDNFFELGGHSLLATMLIVRIKQEMAVDISITDVFKLPEIALLAEYIVTSQLAQFDPDELARTILLLDAS